MARIWNRAFTRCVWRFTFGDNVAPPEVVGRPRHRCRCGDLEERAKDHTASRWVRIFQINRTIKRDGVLESDNNFPLKR